MRLTSKVLFASCFRKNKQTTTLVKLLKTQAKPYIISIDVVASKVFSEDETETLLHSRLGRDGQTCLSKPQLRGDLLKSTQLAPGRAKMSLVSYVIINVLGWCYLF